MISGVGFYDTPEVQALTNLLRVLADPYDDVSLYAVLRSPLFGFTDDRLATLTASADAIWDALEASDDEQFAEAARLLTQWRELAGCVQGDRVEVQPWNRVLTQVIDDTGYLVSIGADENGQQAVANVEKFRDEIRKWSEDGTRTAASLLRRIDRRVELDPREGEAEVPEGADGVRIMTIHAAKGLEFPIVTVPDIGSDLNFGRSVDDYGYVRLVSDHDDPPFLAAGGPTPSDPFEVEKTIAHEYADSVELPRERAEAKRLLYVACTRTRDHLLLCSTHAFDSVEDELAFATVNDVEEARAWRDWLQPALLETPAVTDDLATNGSVRVELGESSYTVSLPSTDVEWQSTRDAESVECYPEIEISQGTLGDAGRQRMTATQLVQAASEWTGTTTNDTERGRREVDSDREDGLARSEFGTIVHRILEFDQPLEDWIELARRIAAVNGFEPTEEDLEQIVAHARDAKSFLEAQDERYTVVETYEELPVSVDVGDVRVVGDIDHLRVTKEAFVITDYKTNRLRARTASELAEHYRPQMASYALALLRQDGERSAHVNLRFTEGHVTESFQWAQSDTVELEEDLARIARQDD